MKKTASIIINIISISLLILLFFWHKVEFKHFDLLFNFVVCAEILLLFVNSAVNLIFEENENKNFSIQDFFDEGLEVKKASLKKLDEPEKQGLEGVVSEIFEHLQTIQVMANLLEDYKNTEPQEVSHDLAVQMILKKVWKIKDTIARQTRSLGGEVQENDILLQLTRSVSLQKKVANRISIGIYSREGADNYSLILRLILQSYGFFVRILEHSQEALFAVEDGLIQMLIVSPKSEDDDCFCLCQTVRKKYSVLEFPILLIADRHSSYLLEKNFEGQINDFLLRPFDVSALVRRIQILENYRNLWQEKQEILKSEKEKTAFLYFVTHNVNTPLTVLLNEIQSLKEDFEPFENTARIEGGTEPEHELETENQGENQRLLAKLPAKIQNIEDCAGQINIIIQNVLDSYRISDGRYLVNPTVISLEKFIAGENKFLLQKARTKNQQVDVEINFSNPRVFCDENSLKGIYVNLLDNAIKYTLPGGRIKISVDAVEDRIFLRIADNGVGVPKEKQPLLFKRFAGIGSKTEKTEQSVGLGLYVVNEICKLNGLELEYSENTAEPSGSVFTVIFKRLG